MVEEWVSEEPHMVCHHVEEQNCYAVMKTKYVPRKVSRVRVWTVEFKTNAVYRTYRFQQHRKQLIVYSVYCDTFLNS